MCKRKQIEINFHFAAFYYQGYCIYIIDRNFLLFYSFCLFFFFFFLLFCVVEVNLGACEMPFGFGSFYFSNTHTHTHVDYQQFSILFFFILVRLDFFFSSLYQIWQSWSKLALETNICLARIVTTPLLHRYFVKEMKMYFFLLFSFSLLLVFFLRFFFVFYFIFLFGDAI